MGLTAIPLPQTRASAGEASKDRHGHVSPGFQFERANRRTHPPDILSGRLGEGEILNEARLVEQFGVSRTPIREAIYQLAHEGLLERRPNACAMVAKHPPDDVRELIVPIRRRLETFALRSYFDSINEHDFERWNEILEKLRQACLAADYMAIAEHDIELHRSIVHRANQRNVESIWMSMVAAVRSHFWKTQATNFADPLEIYQHHARMIETFRQGDVELAVKTLAEQIN